MIVIITRGIARKHGNLKINGKGKEEKKPRKSAALFPATVPLDRNRRKTFCDEHTSLVPCSGSRPTSRTYYIVTYIYIYM